MEMIHEVAQSPKRLLFAIWLGLAIWYLPGIRCQRMPPQASVGGGGHMKIYRYVPESDDYDCLDNRGDWGSFDLGRPLAATWKPVRVEMDDHAGRTADFPSLLGPIPVFSERAWEVLQPLLGASVEALPLNCDRGIFFVVNVLDHVDCLDYDRAEVTHYSSGRVMMVDKFAFKPGSLHGKNMFKLPETAKSEVFVSESFKKIVEKAGLTGLWFEELADVQ
jgi:hypothetical protein